MLDRTFVERTKPDAMHSEETLEEDDSFPSVGSETWDYEIDDARRRLTQANTSSGRQNLQVYQVCRAAAHT